jgi:hypothetical protein
VSEERKQLILETINTTLLTQGGNVDPLALASAIEAALGADTLEAGRRPADTEGPPGAGASPKGAYARVDEGRTPGQLNASNDDGEG